MKRITLAALAFLLAGCGTANENSIFRTYSAPTEKSSVALVDAKQRAILHNQLATTLTSPGENPKVTLAHRTCAEPSPDVFSVLSSSFSANAAFSDGKGKEAALAFARSVAESGAKIGLRTQTIQVLRDMMYRLCERYMNGAINADEFEIQAARDQRIIVSILAIEQLTGAVQPVPVTVSAGSTADAGKVVLDLQKSLTEARADVTAKTKVRDDAKDAHDTANAANPKDQADVDAKKKALDTAELELKDAETNAAAIEEMLKEGRQIRTATTTSSKVVAASQISPTVSEQVAKAVTTIVERTFDVDETAFACLKWLAKTTDEQIKSFCVGHLKLVTVREAKALNLDDNQIEQLMNFNQAAPPSQ